MANLLDNSDLDSQNPLTLCCSITTVMSNLVSWHVPPEHVNQECNDCKYFHGT